LQGSLPLIPLALETREQNYLETLIAEDAKEVQLTN